MSSIDVVKRYFITLITILSVQLLFVTTAMAQVQCEPEADADVVIMIDRTGSIAAQDLENEKNGARALLDFFATAVVRPRVAIGTFNVQRRAPDARILAELTDNYGDSGTPTGLYKVINDVFISPSSTTNLEEALEVSQAELDANASADSPNYVILISDGIPNRPNINDGSCGSCVCPFADQAAIDAAVGLTTAGTEIFRIHYEGTGFDCTSFGEPEAGIAFLRDELVPDTPGSFYLGSDNLSGVFEAISESIICNDGDPCTTDFCDDDKHLRL